MIMNTLKLEKEFYGKGEVKDINFRQLSETNNAYLYQAYNEGNIYYEVFKKKTTALCIDFEKRIFSETEFKEMYPKSNDFGVWAWTISDLKTAVDKFYSI